MRLTLFCIYIHSKNMAYVYMNVAVCNHWTVPLDWTTGMDY